VSRAGPVGDALNSGDRLLVLGPAESRALSLEITA
jgi:hypothetical protein